MPRIAVPDGADPLVHLWTGLAQEVARPAGALSDAVYRRSTLPLREFEAARIAIAEINDCNICLTWRTARDVPDRAASQAGPEPDQAFYDDVLGDRVTLTDRERLAAEFATRFATDHRSLDDDFWAQLHAAFSDDELVELAICIGNWLAFGRVNRVFDVDGACRTPLR
jgi:alkylhydroperoxidase family enzyme